MQITGDIYVIVSDTRYELAIKMWIELGKWPREEATWQCRLCILVYNEERWKHIIISGTFQIIYNPPPLQEAWFFSIPLVDHNYYRVHCISHFRSYVIMFFFPPPLPFLSWAFETGSYRVAWSGLNLWPPCLSLLSAAIIGVYPSLVSLIICYIFRGLRSSGILTLLSSFSRRTISKEDALSTTICSSSY